MLDDTAECSAGGVSGVWKAYHSMQTEASSEEGGRRPAPPALDDHKALRREGLFALQFLQELLLLGWLRDRGLRGLVSCWAGVLGEGRQGNPGGELLHGQSGQS